MVNLYIDMDGVLAKWNDTSLEEVKKEGYFAKRELQSNLLEALCEIKGLYQVYILSAVYQDGHSERDKRTWLKEKEVPFPAIFVPYGECKKDYVESNGINFLLDDYSKNLFEWEDKNFYSIKFRNSFNGTKGTWQGRSISHDLCSEDIAKQIKEVIESAVSNQGYSP